MSGAEAQEIQQAEEMGYPAEDPGYQADVQQTSQEPQAPKEEFMEMGAAEQTGGGDQAAMQVCDPGNSAGEEGAGMRGVAPLMAGGEEQMSGGGEEAEGAPQSSDQKGTDEDEEECKLFVGGLSWNTTEKALEEYFEHYGAVKEVLLKYDRDTHKSRGFAFVHFAEKKSVDKVLKCENHTLDDRVIDVKQAIPHAQHQAIKNRTKKIFVGGVPTDMTKETLEAYFNKFGDIVEVAIVTDKGTTRRRGFVFVTYTTEDAVDKITEISFHTIEGAKVEVKRATPREQFPTREKMGGGGGGGWRGGKSGRGGGGGGVGRAGWVPYGQYGQQQDPYYDGSWEGGYDGYGGGGYGGYGGPSPGGRGGYSRYGPVKNYNQHGGASYHPYSR